MVDKKRCAVCLLGALLLAVVGVVAISAQEPESETLAAALMDAGTVYVISTASGVDISARFTEELEQWGRFEVVSGPFEADITMALSTRPDYTTEVMDSGAGDTDVDEDDPTRNRPPTTVRVVDKLYLKIFVPGEDDLWTDEIEIDDSSEAAKTLLDRLRTRLEAEDPGL